MSLLLGLLLAFLFGIVLIIGLIGVAIWDGIEYLYKLYFGGNGNDRRIINKRKRYKK